jgi:hypothetical protein
MRDGKKRNDEEKEEIIPTFDWFLCLAAYANAISDEARAAKYIKDMFDGIKKD